MQPSSRELSIAVRDLSLAALELHHALAERLEMAPQDLAALTHLGRDGPLTPRELGRRLRLRPASVTAVIDRLERRGDARRRRHPTDGRSILVEASERGGLKARRELAPMIEAVDAAAQALDGEQRAAAAEFLRASTDQVRRHAATLRRQA